MKRARDPTDDPTITTHDTTVDADQRITPGFLNQPAAATTPADDDDDPYGFGNIGKAGFVSKPSGMKSGYVPGFARAPGSAGGAMTSGVSAVNKSARTAMSGPGAKPTTAARGGFANRSQPPAETAQPRPAPAAKADDVSPSEQLPFSPVLAMSEDAGTALMLQRRRVQNKDLPEQHRLPEDLPLVIPGKIAKTSATASGPLSAQIKALPKFHEQIQTFVDQSVPNQAEQLTKVPTAFFISFTGCL